jgi:hypothetical protein
MGGATQALYHHSKGPFADLWNLKVHKLHIEFKDRPSASSHTRWNLGKDYTKQALPLQCALQRGCTEPRTSWHKWGDLMTTAPGLSFNSVWRLLAEHKISNQNIFTWKAVLYFVSSAYPIVMIFASWCLCYWALLLYRYNFHLFPRDELQLGMPSYSFSCQSSYLSTVANDGFDFNLCIYNGEWYVMPLYR